MNYIVADIKLKWNSIMDLNKEEIDKHDDSLSAIYHISFMHLDDNVCKLCWKM